MIQRVVVRMLHDPAFASAVLEGRETAGLSTREVAMLRATDPRAWRTDPYRRGRIVTALLEEFPVSAVLAVPQPQQLDAFLSSPEFHNCVMDRGSLAQAFATWLAPRAGPVAAFEGAVAQARREGPRQPGPRWQRAPGLLPIALPEGTVARWQAMRQRLGADPVQTVVRGKAKTKGLPRTGTGIEWVLVQIDGEQAGLSFVDPALARLIQAADEPSTRTDLETQALALGADDAAAEVVAGLIADGSLVPAR